MVNKLRWLLYRWDSMTHPYEEIYRMKSSFLFFLRTFLRKNNDISLNKVTWHWETSDKGYPKINLKQGELTRIDNDRIIHFHLHTNCLDLKIINNWRQDFKNNIVSPALSINKIKVQHFESFGDIRYVATLNRLHHLPFFLIAYAANNNLDKVPEIVIEHLSAWKNQNPFLRSINWKNGIENGIRLVNLIYTREILQLYSNAEGYEKAITIIDELAIQHLIYLPKNLSLYSSANNHLLYELMGIFIGCCHYKSKFTDSWRDKSLNWLIKELLLQTHEDGFTKEQSTHYHLEVVNIFVLVFREAKKLNMKIPEMAMERIKKMGEAIVYLVEEDCPYMKVGDSDDGQILYPYFDDKFSLKQSLLRDIFILTNKSFLNDEKDWENFDFRNLIIWGNQTQYDSPKSFYIKTFQKIFPKSGYWKLDFEKIRILFDFGELGYGKLAAHGHADIFSFILAIDDEPFIIDPGTYQYHSRFAPWRNYFRGTLAHNTISIEGADQASSVGRMMWRKHPTVKLKDYQHNKDEIRLFAMHDGFVRQGFGITHLRELEFNKHNLTLKINDKLNGKTKHTAIDAIYSLHFAPHLKIESKKDTIKLIGEKGMVIIKNIDFKQAQVLKGLESEEIVGWCSNSFDEKEPTNTLRLNLAGIGKINTSTLIEIIKL